jgi:alpha-D-ribose 1-methylphosphonate 5-triphosphate synthase subunit PhnG
MSKSPFLSQSEYLSVLSHAPADEVKTFVDNLLPDLGNVQVLSNRTGLVMLPYTDTVQGTVFHLGEVLMAAAHVRLGEQEGYGACLGRDLEQALAIAVLDAALQAGQLTDQIEPFVAEQAQNQAQADDLLLRKVETTRVELETF